MSLSNNDFRALMTPGRIDPSASSSGKRSSDDQFLKPPPKKGTFRIPATRDAEKEKRALLRAAQTPGVFRDRAKERRFGITVDYEDTDVVSEERARALTIEESKYMGGDMEHTHLVKGLDFALLSKVKEDLEIMKKLKAEKEAEMSSHIVSVQPLSSSSSSSASSSAAAAAVVPSSSESHQDSLKATTALGRSIRRRLEEKQRNNNSSFRFVQNVTFVFSLDLNGDSNEIPTSISKSKTEKVVVDEERIIPKVPSEVATEMKNICQHIKQHSFKPRPREKKKEPEKPVVVEAEVVTDDHEMELGPEQGPSMPPQCGNYDYSYDDNEDIFADAPSIYVPVIPENPKNDEASKKKVENINKKVNSEEYSECFQGSVEYSHDIMDESDSDNDNDKEDDQYGKKKTRQDFSSTREYEQYLEMRRLGKSVGPSISQLKELAEANARFEKMEAKKKAAKAAKEKSKFETNHSKIMKKVEELGKKGGKKVADHRSDNEDD